MDDSWMPGKCLIECTLVIAFHMLQIRILRYQYWSFRVI